MDAIAEASGVSKATIYKHWADKDALCLEVMIRVHGLDVERPVFNTPDLRKDMYDRLKYEPPEHPSLLRDRLTPHLMAYAVRHQAFGKAWRMRVMEPLRVHIVEFLERGIAEHIFPEDLDIPMAIALLVGPLVYGKMLGTGDLTRDALAEGVVTAFWRAFAQREMKKAG
jgi:AcrR family transcriptional regulator